MCLDDEAQLVLFTALDVIECVNISTLHSCRSYNTTAIPNSWQRASYPLSPPPPPSYILLPKVVEALCISWFHAPAAILPLHKSLPSLKPTTIRARTSKKSAESREEEVRRAASEELITWVEESGETLIREPTGCLIVAEILLYGAGGEQSLKSSILRVMKCFLSIDKSGAIDMLLQALASPSVTEPHLIDLPPTSRLYKALLQGGHFNHTTKEVERVPSTSWDSSAFADKFVRTVGQEPTVAMCVGNGNGAFIVAELCEALIRGESTYGRQKVKEWFGSPDVAKQLEASEVKGKTILLEKLALL